MNINTIDYIKAFFQIVTLFVIRVFLIIVGLFASIAVVLTAKKATNKFGETTNSHSLKYAKSGSSGVWWFVTSPCKILWPWCNDEDGCYGEPSGKWSATCKGKEHTLLNMYKWIALRNPANNVSRYTDLFRCKPEQCVITYAGDYVLTDKSPVINGWQFTKAQHKTTNRCYYGFRFIAKWPDGDVFQIKAGFKVKPQHANVNLAVYDEDKGFTVGIQFKSRSN